MKMASSVMSLLLMLWKNWILQIRRPVGTAVELLAPILLVVILIILRFGQFQDRDQCFSTYDDDPLTFVQPNNTYKIFYTPIGNDSDAVIEIVRRELPFADIVGVDSEGELESSLEGIEAPITFSTTVSGEQVDVEAGCLLRGAGIVFDDLESSSLEYTLRLRHEVGTLNSWNTATADNSLSTAQQPRLTSNPYTQEGFLHLQKVVEQAIIEWTAGAALEDVDVSVKHIPFPEYTSDNFLSTAFALVPFFIVLGFLYPAGSFCKELVLEKESRVRELLLITGLKQWVLWTSWYIKQLTFLFISALLLTILLKFGKIFPQSDFSVILVFLVLFMASVVSFSFMVSVWFDSAQAGLLSGMALFFLNYMPYSYVYLPEIYDLLSLSDKIVLSLLSNSCMGLGVVTVIVAELEGEGVQWSTLFSPSSASEDFVLGYAFIMLLIDTVLYMIIAWYVDAVKPGRYGIARPFYFPFLPSYWTGKPRSSKKKEDVELHQFTSSDGNHEDEPKGFTVSTRIQNLTKIYNKSIPERLGFKSKSQHNREVAVDALNLNLYSDQITALLGHNGAGKTTTMNILTGLYTPTDGTAIIDGFDIRTDMEQIRKSMGICPQHNVLFGRLTVSEHLILFGTFKGLGIKELKAQIKEILTDIDLLDKKDTPSSQLSGGQKRKLSVGIALIGNSKFVVLDEPTSGMDPYARRATWNLLNKSKKGRTILFSTHFMDEADLLGDRIAIMADGKLRCSGCSLFLKCRYGVGYHMIIEKAALCDSPKVLVLVKSLIPGAQCVLDAGAELSLILPSENSRIFPQLFEELEDNKSELGIAGFGVSVTTMEEVFLKVKEESDESIESRVQRRGTLRRPDSNFSLESSDIPTTTPTTTPHSNSTVPNSGVRLWWQQYYGLLLKKMYDTVRFWQTLCAIYLIPITACLLGLLLFRFLFDFAVPNPQRALRVDNSGSELDHQILFWSELDNINTFDFGSLQAGDVRASDLINITAGVLEVINAVQAVTNSSDCCLYKYQLLDTFCALLSQEELASCSQSGFGYRRCTECLQCCQTRLTSGSSCTNPFTQRDNSQVVCPAVPKVSVSDASSGGVGRLDSDNTYISEYLLRYADQFSVPLHYHRRVMGGFTIGRQEPVYSACGCSDVTDFTTNYVAPLLQCSDAVTTTQAYVIPGAFDWYNSTDCSPLIPTTTTSLLSGSGVDGTAAASSVRVDGSSAGLLQGLSCSSSIATESLSSSAQSGSLEEGCGENSTEQRPVSAFYPELTQRTSVTVWYNGKPWHMSAAMLNAFHNVWLRQVTGNPDLSITVNNHPLPRSDEGQLRLAIFARHGYLLAVTVIGGFSILLSLFILPILNEKNSQVKHLQHISGVRPSSYWLSTLTVDGLHCIIIIPIVVSLFAAFQLDAYTGDGLAAVAVLLITTCLSGIPLIYLFSFIFTDGLTAFAILIFLLFLITSQVLRSVLNFITDVALIDALHYVFLLVPTYGLLTGVNDIYLNDILRRLCNADAAARLACDSDELLRYVDSIFSFSRPGIGFTIVYALVEAVVFSALIWLWEHSSELTRINRAVNSLLRRDKGGRKEEEDDYDPIAVESLRIFNALPLLQNREDIDVTAEREKVQSGDIDDSHVVVIRNLKKIYPRHLDGLTLRPQKIAVRGITLAIPKGECFGLLGTNGAGKTTTFRMLTGDLSATSGRATIAGFDVATEFREVRRHIGYCPQFGALLERLTGRELLTVFARLRGIPEHAIKETVASEIRRVDLKKYADKQCGKYSGGNKRKLSTGIALVGNPPVVFLDEPTTGMDTATRHYLWKVLTGIVKNGQSIILTSHSMEECEALCTRVAILVNGQFKCLGSIQHLKNKYGQGMMLQAKVKLDPKPVEEPPVFGSAPRFGTLQRMASRFTRRGRNPSSSSHQHQQRRSETDYAAESSNPSLRRTVSRRVQRVLSRLTSTTSLHGTQEEEHDPYDTSAVHTFIKQTCNGATLVEEHQGFVAYQYPKREVSWSTVFRSLEENKERLGIIDYTISQTTLEQVFINFSRPQKQYHHKAD